MNQSWCITENEHKTHPKTYYTDLCMGAEMLKWITTYHQNMKKKSKAHFMAISWKSFPFPIPYP